MRLDERKIPGEWLDYATQHINGHAVWTRAVSAHIKFGIQRWEVTLSLAGCKERMFLTCDTADEAWDGLNDMVADIADMVADIADILTDVGDKEEKDGP